MSNKPTHTIAVTRKYTNSNGEEKNFYTNVGKAWMHEGDFLSCELEEGIALTGRFVLTKPKLKEDEQS